MIPALRKEDHPLRKSQFTQEQIAFALRQAESRTAVGEVCRKVGVSENTVTGGSGSSRVLVLPRYGVSGNSRKRTAA
jgi:putative transposase